MVIVTGGTSGLGYELIRKLYESNYFICNIARSHEKLKEMDNLFSNNYMSFCGDITDEDFVTETVNSISKLGNIICLINNAFEPSFKEPKDYKKEDITTCLKGLEGMILFTSQVLCATNEKNVRIVNIMSSAALRGNKKESVYCAAKWGQRGYTESLKVAYKGTSVKVIGVYPGGINTNFYKNSRDYVPLEKQATFMEPSEVASIIIENVFTDKNLTISDLVIERNS